MNQPADRPKVLLVDDDAPFRNCISTVLNEIYDVTGAADAQEAMKCIALEKFDIIILDYDLPNISGFELLKLLKRSRAEIPVIMLTGHSESEIIVETMKNGASDYVVKTYRDLEISLQYKMKQVLDKARLLSENLVLHTTNKKNEIENQTLREQLQLRNEKYEVAGISEPILKLRSDIIRLKNTKASVLITGENGTGKELIARNLNIQEGNPLRPFVAINCASISANLFESEFFGHVKGAFTGANDAKIGKFEAAAGGDLFLDEIGELPLEQQSKLLRVLQEKTVTKVGDTKAIPVDFRLIAATNRNLEKEVMNGKFREDLYFRLYQIGLTAPSLRDRKIDILFLANKILKRLVPMGRISEAAENILNSHSWRGNVRELQNTIERAVVFLKDSRTPLVEPEHLMLTSVGVLEETDSIPKNLLPKSMEQINEENLLNSIDWMERQFFEHGLKICKGDNKELYQRLNMSKANYFRKKRILFGNEISSLEV